MGGRCYGPYSTPASDSGHGQLGESSAWPSLRTGKDQRQFIITTHNPNVAVSSDSDKYHVLKGTATTGGIVCAGAIDLENVATEVIEHLEGGVEPYRLRGRKYNL